MKIYIAGPMTGLPDYNRPSFNAEASRLNDEGHCVLNPAVLPSGLTQHEYMDICMAMVRSAEVVYLLKGWRNSEGAVSELTLAKKLGKIITYQENDHLTCYCGQKGETD
jgi:hypothetical protein